MKRLLVGMGIITMLLAGCAQTHPNIANTWVSVSSTTNPAEYYVVTDTTVSQVGNLFGVLDSAAQGPVGWGSNKLPAGTELYTIPGVDVHKAIAVKLKDGTYHRANDVGNKKP